MATLKELREQAFLSQRELAKKAKVNHITVARLETRQHKPHFKTVRALAKALKVQPDEIEF